VADLGAAAVGAVVLAGSIAPTDEVPMLLADASPLSLLAVVALAVSAAMLWMFSNLEGSGSWREALGRTLVLGLPRLAGLALWGRTRALDTIGVPSELRGARRER
jgi:uncharacterized membrane protein